MNTISEFDFSHLTPMQRVELIGALWDSLDHRSGAEPEALLVELERRSATYHAGDTQTHSWEEVKATLRADYP